MMVSSFLDSKMIPFYKIYLLFSTLLYFSTPLFVFVIFLFYLVFPIFYLILVLHSTYFAYHSLLSKAHPNVSRFEYFFFILVLPY